MKYEAASKVSEVSDHLLSEDSDMHTNTQYAPLSPTSLGDCAITLFSAKDKVISAQSWLEYFSPLLECFQMNTVIVLKVDYFQ